MKKEKYPKDDKTFKQSEEKVYKQSERLFKVVFKQNRSAEVFIPTTREDLRFEAHIENPIFPLGKDGKPKYKDGVPESVINDPDFQSIAKNFNIMEVK